MKIVQFFIVFGLARGSVAFMSEIKNPNCSEKALDDISKDPNECFDAPEFFEDKVVDECEKKLGIDSKEKEEELDWVVEFCVSDCIFNTTRITENNQIKKEVFQNQVWTVFKNETTWKSQINSTIANCFTDASDPKKMQKFTKSVKDFSKSDGKLYDCSPDASFIIDCVYFGLFISDANSIDPKNSDCVKLKNYSKMCDEW